MVSLVEPDEPAVLPSATGQERLINILGDRVSGQSTWGQPASTRTAIFPSEEGNPTGDESAGGRAKEIH